MIYLEQYIYLIYSNLNTNLNKGLPTFVLYELNICSKKMSYTLNNYPLFRI